MLDGTADNKNIGLAKNLLRLRQALDVYCLISVNRDAIRKQAVGRKFFGFVEALCKGSIILHIAKIFEQEKRTKQGKVRHDLNSIDGVLGAIEKEKEKAAVLDSAKTEDFVQKYGSDSGKVGLAALRSAIEEFREEHREALSRFKAVRDKLVAHSDSEFSAESAPSYDDMERLFNFGLDFYMLVSQAFISVVPCNLNADRRVKASLRSLLEAIGLEEIKMEMD